MMNNGKDQIPVTVTTKDYSKFQMHQHNRVMLDETGKPRVRPDIAESMMKEGFRPEEPIRAYVNNDGSFTIIDGHNRLVVAQSLGIPVWASLYKRGNKPEWTPLKSSAAQRRWSLPDVCRAYAQEGYPDYLELLDYSTRTGIPLQESASILSGNSSGSGNANKAIHAGSFTVKNRMNGELVADIVATAGQFISWSTDRRFVGAISAIIFVPGFSPNQLKEKIIKHHEFLEKRKDRDEMIEMIDSVYNRHCQVRIDLCAETKKILLRRRGR
jgi:hypothetical protein